VSLAHTSGRYINLKEDLKKLQEVPINSFHESSQKIFAAFFQEAQNKLTAFETSVVECQKVWQLSYYRSVYAFQGFNELALYFAEDPAECTSEELFSTIYSFLESLQVRLLTTYCY
jgi:hypothetical protein